MLEWGPMQRKKILLLVLVLVILLGVLAFLTKDQWLSKVSSVLPIQQTAQAEPLDIVSDFYQPWLQALQSSTTNPLQEGLANNPLLSPALRERLNTPKPAEGYPEGMIDPVICQTAVPENISAKTLYVYPDNKAQVLVFTKGSETGQAIVTLLATGGGWYIDEILCSRGEFDVPREFTFDTEGYLLKQVPPPYKAGEWHLVFEQNGQTGHVVPLLFNADSKCTPLGNEPEGVCTPDQYEEAKKVYIQGQMTELGAEVKHLKFLE